MGKDERDLEMERQERDSFVLLQHAYTVAVGDPTELLPGERLTEALGFTGEEGQALRDHLIRAGFLAERGPLHTVSITPAGIAYIEGIAWRRRSVRLSSAPPVGGIFA